MLRLLSTVLANASSVTDVPIATLLELTLMLATGEATAVVAAAAAAAATAAPALSMPAPQVLVVQ